MISTALTFVISGEVEESQTQNMFVDLIVLKLICFEMPSSDEGGAKIKDFGGGRDNSASI